MELATKKTEQIGLRIDRDNLDFIDKMAKDSNSDRSKVVTFAISVLRQIHESSLTNRIVKEDGFIYEVRKNNGRLVLDRVKRETVEL